MSDYFSRLANNSLIKSLGITPDEITLVLGLWRQPHKFYHSERHHLRELLIRLDMASDKFSSLERETLEAAALFHDAVFFPGRMDNEDRSANLFRRLVKNNMQVADEIETIILDTKDRSENAALSREFAKLDLYVKRHGDLTDLLSYEQGIFLEFQRMNYLSYKKQRLEFLESIESDNLSGLKSYVANRRLKIGLYPGTFSPFHIGHLSILEKAEKIFDKVIVAVGVNPDKDSSEQAGRLEEVQKLLPFHEVVVFDGFLTDLTKQHEEYADVTIIRGLRNGNDLDYEVNQLRFMEELYPEARAMYLVCDKQYEHISSSAIRNLSKIDQNFADKYKPAKFSYYQMES